MVVLGGKSYHSASNSSSPRRSMPPIQVGCTHLHPLQQPVQQVRATRTWENRSRPSSIGGEGGTSRACRRRENLTPPLSCIAAPVLASDQSLWGRYFLKFPALSSIQRVIVFLGFKLSRHDGKWQFQLYIYSLKDIHPSSWMCPKSTALLKWTQHLNSGTWIPKN